MSSASVACGNNADVCLLRFSGDLRYPLAPAIDVFLDRLFTRADLSEIVIDLHATRIIDSTCLGLLARIGTFSERTLARRARLLCGSNDVAVSLRAVGFDEVFAMSTDPAPSDIAMQEVSLTTPGDANLSRVVLLAHRRLLALSASNEAAFGEVVRALERELGEPAAFQR